MRNKILTFVLLAAIAVTAIAAYSTLAKAAPVSQTTDESTPLRTLSINGHGEVTLIPDIAYVYVGVHTELEAAADAVAENNDQAQAVMDALRAAGIAAEDIRTSNFSLWYSQNYDMNGQPTDGKYVVDNSVYITVRDLSKLGNLLDGVVRSGANTINSISFDVLDKDAAMAEARDMAIAKARAEAEAIAKASGILEGSLAPAWAISAFPPPPPPAAAAICLIILPA